MRKDPYECPFQDPDISRGFPRHRQPRSAMDQRQPHEIARCLDRVAGGIMISAPLHCDLLVHGGVDRRRICPPHQNLRGFDQRQSVEIGEALSWIQRYEFMDSFAFICDQLERRLAPLAGVDEFDRSVAFSTTPSWLTAYAVSPCPLLMMTSWSGHRLSAQRASLSKI